MDTDVSHEVEKRLDDLDERLKALEGPAEEPTGEDEEAEGTEDTEPEPTGAE